MCSFAVLFLSLHLCNVAAHFPFIFYSPTRMNTHSIAAKVENDFCTISIYWNDETSDHIRFRCWQNKGLNEMKQNNRNVLYSSLILDHHHVMAQNDLGLCLMLLRGASINQKITDFRVQHLLLYQFIVANFQYIV